MRKTKTIKRFGILLTAILLFQLSYHALHVFTSHISDSRIEQKAHDSQIENIPLTCELCAKLLGQTLFLWVYSTLLIAFTVSTTEIGTKALFFGPEPRAIYLLRGPPSNFL